MTLPDCSTTGAAVAACGAAGCISGVMTIDIGRLHRVVPGRRYRSVVNLALTEHRIQGPQDTGGGLEIDQPRRAARRHLVVHAPFLAVPVLVDMGGGPGLFPVSYPAQQR